MQATSNKLNSIGDNGFTIPNCRKAYFRSIKTCIGLITIKNSSS